MRTSTLALLLEFAGILHVGLLSAGLMMPRVVNFRQHTAILPAFLQQLFWVYYAFIGFCLVSFALITFLSAGELAGGGPLARALCLFLAGFWTLRLIVATFVFDMRPYLTSNWRRVGYWALNLVFVYLPVIYLWAALNENKP